MTHLVCCIDRLNRHAFSETEAHSEKPIFEVISQNTQTRHSVPASSDRE